MLGKCFLVLMLGMAMAAFAVPYEINLAGGTGGAYGSTVYTAPNGTVVTASSGAYSNGSYEMRHMFDNTFGSGTDQYWLPLTGATTTLVINLNQVYYMTSIRVFVYHGYSHHQSRYIMDVSEDGVNYTAITGSWVYSGMYNDTTYTINRNVDYVRFTLVSTTDWLTLNEVELFADSAPVPEPATWCLGLLGLLFLGRKKITRLF